MIRFDIDPAIWRQPASSHGGGAPIEGSYATFGSLRDLVTASQRVFVVAAATELLSHREHSQKELTRKLRRRGFGNEAAEYAVDRLSLRGAQSDRRFVQSWIRSQMRGKGVGRAALLAGLAHRGIDRRLAESEVADFERENPDAYRLAIESHVTGCIASSAERDTVVRRLQRKGFAWAEIREFFLDISGVFDHNVNSENVED